MGSIPVAGAKKAIAHFCAMAFLVPATNRPISKMRYILDWVRIFDQDRSLLARKRSGKNSSVRSLPIKLRVLKTTNRPIFKMHCILDWVRIFDQDRSLLARKRSGKNSSVRSLPVSLPVALIPFHDKTPHKREGLAFIASLGLNQRRKLLRRRFPLGT